MTYESVLNVMRVNDLRLLWRLETIQANPLLRSGRQLGTPARALEETLTAYVMLLLIGVFGGWIYASTTYRHHRSGPGRPGSRSHPPDPWHPLHCLRT